MNEELKQDIEDLIDLHEESVKEFVRSMCYKQMILCAENAKTTVNKENTSIIVDKKSIINCKNVCDE